MQIQENDTLIYSVFCVITKFDFIGAKQNILTFLKSVK